ncbi:hypothetical protein EJB05_04292, partial [Eragrostis curvula]
MATAATYLSFPAAHQQPSSRVRRRQTTTRAAATVTDRQEPPAVVSPTRRLPLRKVPGDYGPPLVGALRDRAEYFYGPGGRDGFFTSRVRAHRSTVVRLNMPPGPFLARDPRVVALLDAASFPVLFDTSLVDKTDLFTGTFMPSTDLTGGYRVLSYVDPAEPSHAPLKQLLFHLLSHRAAARDPHVPRGVRGPLRPHGERAVTVRESRLRAVQRRRGAVVPLPVPPRARPGRVRAQRRRAQAHHEVGGVPAQPAAQPRPAQARRGLAPPLLPPPAGAGEKDYDRLAAFFRDAARGVIDEGERLGIAREEALHNIVFAMCFNSFGGMKILFPTLVKWLGRAGAKTHGRLATEVRDAVRAHGGEVTMRALAEMPLVKSAVYEALRIEPPVPMQYGRAKRDMVVESHDYGYEVREGEMLFGYQPMATRDPRVFARAEEYVPDRFLGEDGERLLRHVVWSNGPETASPTLQDKQCAGKDFVVLIARLLVAEIFLRYDSFDVQVGSSALGSSVTITSLKKATF